jgi:two-component system, OmpR family, response regulator
MVCNKLCDLVTICNTWPGLSGPHPVTSLIDMPAPTHQHLLVVDDDPSVRELLRDCLEGEGFAVSEAENSRAMFERLARGGVDLITLDLMLGGESGLALAAQVRGQYAVPIVMITGRGDTIDRVVGLEVGADDYISKPFHPREVIARIRAVLRRAQGSNPSNVAQPPSEKLSFDGWTLDIGRRELAAADKAVQPLTTAEFNLLEALLRRPQRVLSRDVIMDLIKGHDWTPFDRSIDALVSRLRRKIESDPDHPSLVKTVRGVGYIFACDVTAV